MSNSMDRSLLSNVPDIGGFQRATAQTVQTRIEEAMQGMPIAVSDSYDHISVFSIYWKSDNSGGAEDSSLFIQTLSKIQNVQTCQQILEDDAILYILGAEIVQTALQSGGRKLFILHYAGHAIDGSTPDSLIITPKTGQELGSGPELDMSHIKDQLKKLGSKSSGLDVLLVMDSCCAAIAGQGVRAKSMGVEFMAATARDGISNSRKDEWTFTQHWCKSFTKLLEIGQPFTCDDIIKDMTHDSELERPSKFILHEGWNLPITFDRLHPGPIESTLLVAVSPTSSTLLLLRIPVMLQELLVLPKVALILTDS